MNPILQKAAAAMMAKVNPRLVPVVNKLVAAGKQLMYSPQTRHLMQQQLKGGANDPEVIGQGIAKLLGLVYHASRQTAPVQALVPAGIVLLCDGLQFLEDAGMAQVTPQFLAQCTQAAGTAILQMLGISPERMQAAMQQAHAQTQGAPAGATAAPAAAQGAATAPPAPAGAGIIGSAMGGA